MVYTPPTIPREACWVYYTPTIPREACWVCYTGSERHNEARSIPVLPVLRGITRRVLSSPPKETGGSEARSILLSQC